MSDLNSWLAFFESVLRISVPLVFAALGGLLSERTGTVQIGLEGMMLIGALVGATLAHFTHSPWLGFFVAGFAGLFLALIMAVFVFKLNADQIVTGVALNIFIFGLCPTLTKFIFNSTGSTPSLALEDRFTFEPILVAALVFMALLYIYKQTRLGLWIQFAGEAPEALTAAGVSLKKVRWFSLMSCGFLAGLGGASLSLFLASSYSPFMTAGRGFMALAALIFGRWKPAPTLAACLFFALTEAVQIRLQGTDTRIPVSFIQILPYLVTIVAVAGVFGKTRAPKALGK